jgi:dolichol-phosphate mannosyltransferase
MSGQSHETVVITIPTYNEAENIGPLIEEILTLPCSNELHVLIVDDNSPDGTGKIAARLSKQNPRVQTLIRTKRRGRGAAGIDGFKAALALRPDYVIEMDGDFSHQPRFIPPLIEACRDSDAAIGSRFIPGGADLDRSFLRRAITLLVRRFIRRLFRTDVHDVSSGFRCFRREILERVDVDDLISVGPSIVLEILYKMVLSGARIREVPIEFVDRRRGRTKLNWATLAETLLMALKFRKLYGPPPQRRKP